MAKEELWVVAQLEEGELIGVSRELTGLASKLAPQADEIAAAVLIGEKDEGLSDKLIALGADRVYTVTGSEYAVYNSEIYGHALAELIKKYKPSCVMFGATADGRDLAPRVAARLGTGLCADCTVLGIEPTGLVQWTRPAMGGNLMGTIVCSDSRPQMGTIRPKVFDEIAPDPARKGEVIPFTPETRVESRVELVERKPLSTGKIKIEDAEIVVSGGRGMGSAENFACLQDLADLFDKSAVAGSRAAVDEKWVDHASQVGQSGKTIKPRLYFACGISGAMQHLTGMRESETIVAINKDENAPIFQVAHYGVVGDARKIVPLLVEKIKAFKDA